MMRLPGKTLAVLLVPEPDRKPELLKNLKEDVAIADDRLEFLRSSWSRPAPALEGDTAVPVLDPDAQRTLAFSEQRVGRIEQSVLLEAPAPQRRAPR